MAKVLGIDLGTTNSCMAVMEGGQPTVIPNSEGGRTTPSIVAFAKDGTRLVGEVAKRQAVTNPQRTIRSIKRKMGTSEKVNIDGKDYTPQEISAMILQKMRADAEAFLGEKINQAVITVPAYFNDNQRQATKDAGKIAGLEVLRIINEPTASTLAYGMDKEEGAKILVFDLGGGTFDVSILDVGDGVFEVLSTSGDTQLGGDDWDQRIMEHLAKEFKDKEGIDLKNDPMAMQRLRDAAEKAKIELSGITQTQINLPYLTSTQDGPKHLETSLSRARFEEMTRDLMDRTRPAIKQALADAKLSTDQIDRVILVGGSTRMPAVANMVKEFFGKDPYKNINPDECVALGAGLQGGVLAGEVSDIVLLDVTSLSLGVETLGGVFDVVIPRNTTIPSKKTKVYSTASDNQTTVEVHVLQGERKMVGDNTSLGRFHLMGIPPAPRGIPQVEVTFDIDANGIVNVSAKDKATGKEQRITITASTNLSQEDIEQKIKEAEAHAEEDERKKELADARNQADGLLYTAKRTLDEMPEDQVTNEEREAIEKASERLRQILDTEDVSALKAGVEELSKALYALTTRVYQQSAQQGQDGQQPHGAGGVPPDAGAGPGGPGGQGSSPDGGYVDADYKVVDNEE